MIGAVVMDCVGVEGRAVVESDDVVWDVVIGVVVRALLNNCCEL